MTRKRRSILFIVLLVVFIAAAPATVLYSQGYRFDWQRKKIVQVGGLYFKVLPKAAQIYIDGKLKEKTDILFGASLIENLLPRKYSLKIEKAGYLPWQKNLEVKERQVTEIKNVILVPQNPNFSIIAKNVEDVWLSADEKKLLFKDKTEKASLLNALDAETHTLLLAEKEDMPTKSNLPMSAPNVVASCQTPDGIYYLDNRGYIFKNPSQNSPGIKINPHPLSLIPNKKYKLAVFAGFVFLEDYPILYRFNPETKLFEKFFEPIRESKLSPGGKKLLYFSDYEIWVLFLREKYEGIPKKTGEKLFLARLSEKISDVTWLTSDYLIIGTSDKLKIVETDERDKINIVDWIDFFNEPRLLFNQATKRLYVLSQDILYGSERLIR